MARPLGTPPKAASPACRDSCLASPERTALRERLEAHAASELALLMEAPDTAVVVLSTRARQPTEREDGTRLAAYDGLKPAAVADLVKAHLEALEPCPLIHS